MGDDIDSGLLSMSVCFNFRSTNVFLPVTAFKGILDKYISFSFFLDLTSFLQKIIYLRRVRSHTALSTDEMFLKVVKKYFKSANFTYTNQFQWHRLLRISETFYLCQSVFL